MEVPRHWRLKRQRYRLIGEQCPHCEEKIFPPRDICPRCGEGTLKNNLEMKVSNTVPAEPITVRKIVGITM